MFMGGAAMDANRTAPSLCTFTVWRFTAARPRTMRSRGRYLYFAAAPAACSISFATTSGWEMNATWLDLTSLVLAFIRFA